MDDIDNLLDSLSPVNLDKAENTAVWLERIWDPAIWTVFIENSKDDVSALQALQALLRRLRARGPLLSYTLESLERERQRKALEQLIEWAFDVVSGVRDKSQYSERGQPGEKHRDILIAHTVEQIHERSKWPKNKVYEEVGKRLHLTPDAIRKACGRGSAAWEEMRGTL